MKFKCKVITPNGKEMVDWMTAPNETKLKELYSMQGYQVTEILEKENPVDLFEGLDEETMAKVRNASAGVPNMGGGSSQHVPVVPAPSQQKPPEYKEYTDNGMNYRVELNSGKLQKQDWVKMNAEELKGISFEHEGKMVTAHSQKLKLYRLEWVDLT